MGSDRHLGPRRAEEDRPISTACSACLPFPLLSVTVATASAQGLHSCPEGAMAPDLPRQRSPPPGEAAGRSHRQAPAESWEVMSSPSSKADFHLLSIDEIAFLEYI